MASCKEDRRRSDKVLEKVGEFSMVVVGEE